MVRRIFKSDTNNSKKLAKLSNQDKLFYKKKSIRLLYIEEVPYIGNLLKPNIAKVEDRARAINIIQWFDTYLMGLHLVSEHTKRSRWFRNRWSAILTQDGGVVWVQNKKIKKKII